MPVERVCQECGEAYAGPPNKRKKFCSAECYNASRRALSPCGTKKRCSTCRDTLPLDAFHARSTGSGGASSVCKPCYSEYYKGWREGKEEELSAYYKDWRANKAPCEGACERCGAAFRYPPSQPEKHCSRACYEAARMDEARARWEAVEREGQACTACGEHKAAEAFRREFTTTGVPRRHTRCDACRNAQQRAFSARHPERIRRQKREYYRRHTEQCKRRAFEWRIQNPERVKRNKRRAYLAAKNDPQQRFKMRVNTRNRRARLRSIPGFHTDKDIIRLWHRQRGECARCGVRLGTRPSEHAFDVDHIIPISRSECNPSNWPKNLQLLCEFCNSSKHNRTPAEFSLYLKRKGACS